jgi:uncharacterized protein (DUF2147 family)
MRTLVFHAVVASIALTAPTVQAASIDGDWLTPNGVAKVRIAPCATGLCGTIIALKSPNDATGRPQKDGRSANPALRSRPVVGLEILHGLKVAGEGRWDDGTIYNPGDGTTYRSKITLRTDGGLNVDGCVAFICLAQTWVHGD